MLTHFSPAHATAQESAVAYLIDPLTDARWNHYVASAVGASVFHTARWLTALARTYGYEPAVLTTSAPDDALTGALVFCRARSWIAGRRMISLPFSDHCEPLGDRGSVARLIGAFQQLAEREGCRYAEIRPTVAPAELCREVKAGQSFYLHRLDLRPGATEVYRRFHKDCVQRKIRRAEKERIDVVEVRSHTDAKGLADFYDLMLKTRRRHGIPPQPLPWFRNLMDCLAGSALIRLAVKDGEPIAGMLLLEHGASLMYKYGASDSRHHNLGAMPLLFWLAIQDAARRGLEELDMGRSEPDNTGLVTFKEHWGAARSDLRYWSFPAHRAPGSYSSWKVRLARQLCSNMPDRCLSAVGTLIYRHLA